MTSGAKWVDGWSGSVEADGDSGKLSLSKMITVKNQ